MTAENFTYSKAGGIVTCPVPSANPELVALWLRKVRIGALCGLVVIVSHVVYIVLGIVGIAPAPRLANAITCAAAIVGGIGIWLLASSEPQNRKWLWWCRWILRLAAGTLVLLCGISLATYGVLWPLPENAAHDMVWRATGIVMCGVWVLLYWYLRTLSQRFADTTLRKSFGFLFWLSCVLIILVLVVVAYEGLIQHGGNGVSSTTSPAKAQAEKPNAVMGFTFWMAYYVWMGWLMWRLSRRLNQLAVYYKKLSVLSPPTEPKGEESKACQDQPK